MNARKAVPLGILTVAVASAVPLALRDNPPQPVLLRTEGAVDRHITQSNISKTICIPGYTAQIRPPVSYTNKLKIVQINELDYSDENPTHYEEDHIVPLGLGGHPTSEKNLWPEPIKQAHITDVVETKLHKQVCIKQITLKAGRAEIRVYKRTHG